MFAVNDKILYGAQGVYEIAEIRRENLCGTPKDYYILKPAVSSGSTIYVPLDNEALTGKMRLILTAEEIHALIREIPDKEALWIENELERKEKYHEIIAGGDPHAMVQMIKALYQLQQSQKEKGRKFHIADQNFFRTAEKLLYDEFAAALNMKPCDVLPYITAEIEKINK